MKYFSDITHGVPLCRVSSTGPLFPADVDTKMFFSIAANVAIAIGSSYKGASSKPNDNERISTPSSIALSIAAIVSDTYAHSFHNTLYMVRRTYLIRGTVN
jgi:hypothetical protein